MLSFINDIKKVRLGDVASTASGTTPSRSEKKYWEAGTIPWVKTSEVAFQRILTTEEAITVEAINETSLQLLPVGTVLVAMYGQGKTRGHSAILGIEAAVNQACFAILPNETFLPEYLQYWLQASYQDLRHLSEGRGGNQANLNGALLKELRVPWINRDKQNTVVKNISKQFEHIDKAHTATTEQIDEVGRLTDAIIAESVREVSTKTVLNSIIDEVKKGVGENWSSHAFLGASRAGLSAAKVTPGKHAYKYKPVNHGTVFYNPMAILTGSIAMVDDDDTPGITSPDYVVLHGKEGLVDSRWLYYWLRSPLGANLIKSLVRGGVRQRLLFNRLAKGELLLPSFPDQQRVSMALKELKPIRKALEYRLSEIKSISSKILETTFKI